MRRKRIKDKTGMKFGLLTVIEKLPIRKKKYWWKCKCECGEIVEAEGYCLLIGGVYGCKNCVKPIRYAKVSKAMKRHGRAATPMFYLWETMKQRCFNPKVACYERYGGRGITVCERWANSFELFLADMGERPDGMQLDRIDNNGPYSPENCKWSTIREQTRNKRNNKLITFQGETMALVDWCERLGLKYGLTNQRITRDKWSVERAFSMSSILPL